MEIIKQPHITFIGDIDGKRILRKLEDSGRKCWQTDSKEDSSEQFVGKIIGRGHTSVLEHEIFTCDIITDRGVMSELTRHRIASYSIESTRYVKYNGRMQFIKPVEFCKNPYEEKTPDDYELERIWENSCRESEIAYISMLSYGAKPELARQVLNNSLKTEIRFTINMRSARNFFDLRCDVAAHPHMKQVAIPMLLFLQEKVPVLFDDIKYDKKFADKYLKNWRDMVSVKEIGG